MKRILFLALLLALVPSLALAQYNFTCSQQAPTSIAPGQQGKFRLSVTNSGIPLINTAYIQMQMQFAFPAGLGSLFTVVSHASSDPNCLLTATHTQPTFSAMCYTPYGAWSFLAGETKTYDVVIAVNSTTPVGGPYTVTGDLTTSGLPKMCTSTASFKVGLSCDTKITLPAVVQAGSSYDLRWSETGGTHYEIQESTSADFTTGVTTVTATGTSQSFRHDVQTATRYYYRVRTTDCGGTTASYSAIASTVVAAVPTFDKAGGNVTAPFGTADPIAMYVNLPAPSAKESLETPSYGATIDRSFFTVTPSTGTLPAKVTVSANATGLPAGTSSATMTITSGSATVASIPLSVTLATPVTPASKSVPPPPNTLVIPVVTHVNSAVTTFLSDIRLTNASTSSTTHQLVMTPTRTDGTQTSYSTPLTVGAGKTIALNDIANTFFGFGATGTASDQGFGTLEIRPSDLSSVLNFASSRTYATSPSGTLGQFVPAVPYSTFATNNGGNPHVLSLQQIAHTSDFRMNLGLAEGSGAKATGTIRIVDVNGTVLKSVPFSLQPFEHQQINQFIAASGVSSLDDGRIELTVDSSTGAVTAYASVIDNATQDPYAVAPVRAATVSATRFVLPGIAELNNGAANFHSNVRVFNGGGSTVTLTPTYYPQGRADQPVAAAAFTVAPGQVKRIDSILASLFQLTNTGGSLLLVSPVPASVVATAVTYSSAAAGGTYGQFIPGVTSTQGVGAGERGLQILQLESSPAFRTNVGLVELTGNAAHVRVTLILPDSITSPVVELDLAANEFRQFSIASMNPATMYNARAVVEVTSGTGRVAAYGSVIDNRTQDPTYVPAQ